MELAAQLKIEGFFLAKKVFDDGAVGSCCHALDNQSGNVGTRNLLKLEYFRNLARNLGDHESFASVLNAKIPIQATVFVKSKARNWGVALHQDRMVPMLGEGRWPRESIKEGVPFVRPDLDFMDELVALRINLDSASDGDLEVVPGSHRSLKAPPRDATQVLRLGKGDVFVMKPLLYHASSKLKSSRRRRVLHLVYGPQELPGGHRWPFDVES